MCPKPCRNLGVMLDCNMTMSHQISSIYKSVRYQLRNIGFIRKYLTQSATEKLVHALISSRLDFGNALLFNLPQTQLSKAPNAAARIVTLSKKLHSYHPYSAITSLVTSPRSHCLQNLTVFPTFSDVPTFFFLLFCACIS